MKCDTIILIFTIIWSIDHTVARPTFGSLLGNANFTAAHLFPFLGAQQAIGNDQTNAAVEAALQGLTPGTNIFFAQPINSAFDALGSSVAGYAQAQAANVALLRLTQQLGGIMGSIFPMPSFVPLPMGAGGDANGAAPGAVPGAAPGAAGAAPATPGAPATGGDAAAPADGGGNR